MSAKAPLLSIRRTAPCDPLSPSIADGAGPCWTCQLVHAVVVRAMSAVTLRRMGLRAADHAKLAHTGFRCQPAPDHWPLPYSTSSTDRFSFQFTGFRN